MLINGVKRFYFKEIALALVVSLLIIGVVPKESMAYVVGATAPMETSRAKDMDKVQRLLESKLLAQKLKDAGLTTEEVRQRLDKLSDAELHQFTGQVDNVYPGGGIDIAIVVALLVIVVIVVALLKLSKKKIVIQDAK